MGSNIGSTIFNSFMKFLAPEEWVARPSASATPPPPPSPNCESEDSLDSSDSSDSTKSTITSTSRSNSNSSSLSNSPASNSSPAEMSDIFPSNNPIKYIEDLLDAIKKSVCNTTKQIGYGLLFGAKQNCPQFPFAELHVHLEGVFTAEELKEMAVEANLFYDEVAGVFRRKKYSSKTDVERIPASQVDILKIKSKACVQNNTLSNLFALDEDLKKTSFDDTFKIRGSVLDRVKLSTQLLLVMKKAKEHNIIYRELMYGIYDIPVPEEFTQYVEKLASSKKFLDSDVQDCIEKLQKTKLKELLSSTEKQKLIKKIQFRFSHVENFDLTEFFNNLLDLNYVDAKSLYIQTTLDKAELEIQETIANDNDDYGLDSNISIFDERSVRSIKLIDEVMRHYSLGKFITWLLSACSRIQKSKETQNQLLREVAVTVDGPQNEEARKNFLVQVLFLKKMRKLFPDVPFSMHALEYPENTAPFKDELEHVISICEADEQGRGRGRIGHGTRAAMSKDVVLLIERLIKSKIAIEFAGKTAELTTETQIREMPMKYFHKIGVPVTFNTDDPGVFGNIDIRSEIIRIIEICNFSYSDIKNAMITAIENSYMSEYSKKFKLDQLNKDFEALEQDIMSEEKKNKATTLHLWS